MKLQYIKPETAVIMVCADDDIMNLTPASFNDLQKESEDELYLPVEEDDDTGDVNICSKQHISWYDTDF